MGNVPNTKIDGKLRLEYNVFCNESCTNTERKYFARNFLPLLKTFF